MRFLQSLQRFDTKITFPLELFINGTYIAFYALHKMGKWPDFFYLIDTNLVYSTYTYLIPLVLLFVIFSRIASSKSIDVLLRKHIFSIIVLAPILISWGDREFLFWLSSAHLLSSTLSLYEPNQEEKRKAQEEDIPQVKRYSLRRLTPAQLVMFSFGSLILLGGLLLYLPVSSSEGKQMTFVDALFLSASAVSTTGLSTVSVGDDLSYFGQAIVLLLVQVGAVGIMTLSSTVSLLIGKSMSMREKVVLLDVLDADSMEDIYRIIADVLQYTFFIEVWGWIVLTYGFFIDGLSFEDALYQGFFHSISAFCTAGFSLFNTSLESFSTNFIISGGIIVLSVLGGLGFIVLKECKLIFQKKMPYSRLSLHSKVILASTAIFLFFGSVIFFFSEYMGSLDGFSLFEKTHIALFHFMSALTTAGFNSIPMASMHVHTIFLLMLAMFVGASPGSTAGGIKITTVSVLFQSIKTTLTGRRDVEFFRRVVPNATVIKATAITMISIIIVSIFIFLMIAFEPNQSLLTIMFEVISAFGTVGLSLGITSSLSVTGKILLTILMYIGRIGPLTLVLAVGENQNKNPAKYPQGKIMIG